MVGESCKSPGGGEDRWIEMPEVARDGRRGQEGRAKSFLSHCFSFNVFLSNFTISR